VRLVKSVWKTGIPRGIELKSVAFKNGDQDESQNVRFFSRCRTFAIGDDSGRFAEDPVERREVPD
jgi:hypothetical protein